MKNIVSNYWNVLYFTILAMLNTSDWKLLGNQYMLISPNAICMHKLNVTTKANRLHNALARGSQSQC